MKATVSVRTLVLLALTNPLVWLLVVLALLLVMCWLGLLLYRLLFEYARNELCSPRSPASVPADDDWPLLPPAPELVAQLDEEGRVELLVEDPFVAERLDEQESKAAPPPLPVPAAARTTKKPVAAPAVLTREQADELSHAQLVTLARRNGKVAANKRWSRPKLVEAVLAVK